MNVCMYVGQEKQTLVYIYAECSFQPHRHANTIYYMPTPATSNNVMIFIAKSRPRINIRHRRHHFKSTALILLDRMRNTLLSSGLLNPMNMICNWVPDIELSLRLKQDICIVSCAVHDWTGHFEVKCTCHHGGGGRCSIDLRWPGIGPGDKERDIYLLVSWII